MTVVDDRDKQGRLDSTLVKDLPGVKGYTF